MLLLASSEKKKIGGGRKRGGRISGFTWTTPSQFVETSGNYCFYGSVFLRLMQCGRTPANSQPNNMPQARHYNVLLHDTH
jgi:hypothetical protein